MSSREPTDHSTPPPPRALGAVVPVAPASRERGVGPVDALTRYMSQLAKHAPISREAEHALAVRWREQGDKEAGRQLVLANLRLVVKIAMEYRRAWTNVLDLIQEGNLGLLQAVQRFDPQQGVKLSSYGAYWIRAFILKYLIDNVRIVRMGRSRAERKLFFRLNREKRELERQGFRPEPALLAERLEVTEKDVTDFEARMARPELSMNAPVGRDGDKAEVGDFIAARQPNSEDVVGDRELRGVFLEKVQAFSAELEARDQQILRERMLAEEPRTLAELGDEFGVSRERVRQLEARLMQRLKEYLKQEMVDFEFYSERDDDA